MKRRGNNRFQIVSMWNTRAVFAGMAPIDETALFILGGCNKVLPNEYQVFINSACSYRISFAIL